MEQNREHIEKEVNDFLDRHLKMVLAINDESGYPNASLMHYVSMPHFRIFFGTRKGFGKYQSLMKDNRVSFVIIEEGVDPMRVVDGRGIAEEIDPQLTPIAYDLFKSKNDSTWYVEHEDDFVMFEVKPTSIRWLDGSSGKLERHDLLHA